MRSKRHHSVPQFYLKSFCGSDGLLWFHDIEQQKAFKVNPADAVVEKYLYSPEIGDDPHDDTLESVLAEHIDGPAVEPIEKLAKGDSLTEDDRARIAIFVAYQDYRIPKVRDSIGNFVTEIGEKIMKISAEHPDSIKSTLDEIGDPISDEEVEKIVKLIKENQFKVEATKISWLGGMTVPAKIADVIYKMPWAVITAPKDFEFITSDSPVVKILTDKKVPAMFAGGWLSPSAEGTFALDPHTCLVIRPDGIEARFMGHIQWCKDVNSRLIKQAKRFVISNRREKFVEKVAEKQASQK